MESDYDGYDSADLAHHITGLITERIGRVWDGEANERLSAWLADSTNRSMAVEWLVYVGQTEDDQLDALEEFALRVPMVEALTGSRHERSTGFVAIRRRWWSPRR